MSKTRKPKPAARRTPKRLATADVGALPWVNFQWWRNTTAGLVLHAVAWDFTQAFFGAFSRATVEHAFWASDEFWFFALGAALWTLWFFGSIWSMGRPRPLRAYVFGHELTHAIWVWACFGRVSQFEVRRDGGHILTDTHNFWIALAPYFYPLYSLAVIILYGAASLFYNVAATTGTFMMLTPLQWLFLLLGATWAFHLSFTLWMIPKGQSDLTYHGTFFSLVVIYLMNVIILAVGLIVMAPEITFASFGRELLGNAGDFYEAAAALGRRLLARP